MYLKKTYRTSKGFFLFVILFIAFEAFFTWKGIENTPFFLWGMYSKKEVQKDTYTVYQIYINGESYDYNSLSDIGRESLISPLCYYQYLNDRNYFDPVAEVVNNRFIQRLNEPSFRYTYGSLVNNYEVERAFPLWLKGQLERRTNNKIDSVRVTLEYYSYNQEGRPIFIKSRELIQL